MLGLAFGMYLNTYSQCGEVYHGEGTFYGYGGGGNCSFPDPDLPAMTGAMNQMQYDSSAICGACVEVSGARGSLNIRIEDRCPECAFGDIDLSETAFPLVADPIDGRVPISWRIIPCPVTGPLQFYFKEGSSQWWTAVQVRNHKYPIASFEYKKDGEWIPVERMMYNYFLVESGMGVGPYDFKITDILDHEITETAVLFVETTVIDGTQQFETCTDNGLLQQTIGLHEGWNLVSLNLDPSTPAVDEVFPNATIVKTFDGFYTASQAAYLNSISHIEAGVGYMVYNSVNEMINVIGVETSNLGVSVLQSGWNLVGIPSQSIYPITNLPDEVQMVKDFDGYYQKGSTYNSLQYLYVSKAYFFMVSANCEIVW